ncbi:MAG: hypothetical protein FJ218_08345 [Ignavibacteria bacterium]|nr:hypothetical protein [Ignavibacteria bacterium]
MDFLLWSCKSLHIFSTVVLLGGILFQAGVLYPVARVETYETHSFTLHLERRFIPFVWLSLWTLLITGVFLSIFSEEYHLFEFSTQQQILLLLKELTFLLIALFSFGYVRIFRMLEKELTLQEPSSEAIALFLQRMKTFRTINVFLGITVLLLVAGMK